MFLRTKTIIHKRTNKYAVYSRYEKETSGKIEGTVLLDRNFGVITDRTVEQKDIFMALGYILTTKPDSYIYQLKDYDLIIPLYITNDAINGTLISLDEKKISRELIAQLIYTKRVITQDESNLIKTSEE